MKSFCATKIHEYLHHLDLLAIITIESPYRMTEISGKFRWKEETRRQKQLPCNLKKLVCTKYNSLVRANIALSNGQN